jgi:hypothetical protein
VEGLEALGNAGVVPIIIFLTQLIKTKIGDFRYGSDVLALGMSMVLCVGWTFYYMSTSDFDLWAATNFLEKFKWGINQLIVGFATWLAASKIYDLGHGNKKREVKVTEERKLLEEKIVGLENGNGNGEPHEVPVEEDDLSSRLREILEEGS